MLCRSRTGNSLFCPVALGALLLDAGEAWSGVRTVGPESGSLGSSLGFAICYPPQAFVSSLTSLIG